MKKIKYVAMLLVLVFCLTGCERETEIPKDETAPVILGFNDHTLEYGEIFDVLDGVTAYDETDGDLSTFVRCTTINSAGEYSVVSTTNPDTYTVTCSVFDNSGNTTEITKTIIVEEFDDTEAPVFVDVEDQTIEYGYSYPYYNDIDVSDNFDTNLRDDVVCTITLDGTEYEEITGYVAGDFTIQCSVSDTAGNEGTLSWVATVLPQRVAPTIVGAIDTIVEAGDIFYASDGVVASDTIQGDLTQNMSINIRSGGLENLPNIDTTIPAVYSIVYTVINDVGMSTTVTRTVNVVDTTAPVITADDLTMANDAYYDIGSYFSAVDIIDGEITPTYEIRRGTEVITLENNIYGSFVVVVTAEDSSGNIATKNVSLLVSDEYGPTITIVEEVYRHLSGEPFEIGTYFAVDDLSDTSFNYSYEYTNVETSEVLSFPNSFGEWTAQITVTDTEGNQDSATMTVIMIGDTVEMYYPLTGYDEAFLKLWNFYNQSLKGSPEDVCADYINDQYLPVSLDYDNCILYVTNVNVNTPNRKIIDFSIDYNGQVQIGDKLYYNFDVWFDAQYGLSDYNGQVNVFFKQLEGDILYQFDFYDFPFPLGDGLFSEAPNGPLFDEFIDDYYTGLIEDIMEPDEFCNVFGIDGLTTAECEAIVVEYRQTITGYGVTGYSDTILDLGTGLEYLAREVEIKIEKGTSYYINTIQVIEIVKNGVSEFSIIGDSIGDGYYEIPYSHEDITDVNAGAEVEYIYDSLFNPAVTPTDFCTQFYMNNFFYDTELSACENYVTDIRTHIITYELLVAMEYSLYTEIGKITYFSAFIEFTVDGYAHQTEIELVFSGKEGIVEYSFMSPYIVDLGNAFDMYDFVTVTDVDFIQMINDYYSDLNDTTLSGMDFCTSYIIKHTSGPDGISLSFAERTGVRQTANTYTYISHTYSPGDGVEFLPTYYVQIDLNGVETLNLAFHVVNAPTGEIMLIAYFPISYGG